MKKTLQCKHIPNLPVLQRLADLSPSWAHRFEGGLTIKTAFPEGTPDKLLLAKMRMLIDRRLVDGCTCGCRGDFYITDSGRVYLAAGKEA